MRDSAVQDIICCMGQPVAGNPLQFMLERAIAASALDWRFLTFEVSPQNLPPAVAGLRALGFRGAHFMPPHKATVTSLLDELSPTAALIGAVNCVRAEEGRWIGENTEGEAFLQSLEELVKPKGKQVVVLGAGSAARAIALQLARVPVGSITVVNRSSAAREALVQLLRAETSVAVEQAELQDPYRLPEGSDILIQATSVGQGDPDEALPLDVDFLSPALLVADIVFNPSATWLLRQAERRCCQTLDGLGMLVNKAALEFRMWTGCEPDRAVMREALEEYLEI